MDHNPFQASQVDHQPNRGSERPLWVYVYTIGSFLSISGIPAVIFAFGNPFDFAATLWIYSAAQSVGMLVGSIVAWRTWRRLCEVHRLQIQLQTNRETIRKEYVQRVRRRNSEESDLDR